MKKSEIAFSITGYANIIFHGKKKILDSVYHQSKVALTGKAVPKKMVVTAYFLLKVLLLKYLEYAKFMKCCCMLQEQI